MFIALKRKWLKARRFFRLYTSGLSRDKVEQLLKRDAVGTFQYLKSKTGVADEIPEHPTIRTTPFVIKEIFFSFVLQLTPARRLFYGIAVAGFVVGLVRRDLLYLVGSFLLINFLLAMELVDKLTTRDELEIAREIQLSLLPDHIPQLQMLSIATFSEPARMVGGDFFDIVQPNNDMVISILGDVSGKGISAALYATYIQSTFQSLSETSASPAELMCNLNNLITRRLHDGHFVTAIIAVFDTRDRSVTIARAGHNWPLYYSADSQSIIELKPKGVSIGPFESDQFTDVLEEQKIFMRKGDFLLLYSDGITEAADPDKKMFELAGLKSAITESIHEPSQAIIGRINERVHAFARSDELRDDATMLGIKVEKDDD
jgi:sigma-B regulation protein RsbU (phosphoserine phosphatase)